MKSSRRPTIRRRGVVIVPLAAVRASCEGHGDYAQGGDWWRRVGEEGRENGRGEEGRESRREGEGIEGVRGRGKEGEEERGNHRVTLT